MAWSDLTKRACAALLGLVLAAGAGPHGGAAKPIEVRPIEVRVVIVTTWEAYKDSADKGGEMHAWRTKWPLATALPFPAGNYPLQYDTETHVLAVVTGMATARAAASVMALGLDPRFDLTHAYWIVAGTAGVAPGDASAGSAAWTRWAVDGDLMQDIDAREIPADWSTGAVPNGRTAPFQAPRPPIQNDDGNVAYKLNTGLVHWAYETSRGVTLNDSAPLQALRAPYAGPGGKPPVVLEGDSVMSARFWFGEKMNQWARDWTKYWTAGEGTFAMSAEEDTGVMQAITQLSGARKADLNRVLLLRAGSDYTVPPPGMTATALMAKENTEGFPGTPPALDNLYRVASPVARALEEGWAQTRDHIPGG